MKTYNYTDEAGNLLFQIVRGEAKSFYGRKLAANGNWENNLQDVRRVLYRLKRIEDLKKVALNEQIIIFISEGEKDVETLEKIGCVATTNPLGAGKWRDEYSDCLKELRCVILPDNDDAGRNHARIVAQSLFAKASSVQIVELPGLKEKEDITDWINKGNNKEDLLELVDKTPFYNSRNELKLESPSPAENQNKGIEDRSQNRKQQKDKLLEIVEGIELFHTPNQDCFAVTVAADGHLENLNIQMRNFRSWLAQQLYEREKEMPSSQMVNEVIETLRGRALFDSECYETHVRVAEHNEEVYIDLCNQQWQAVCVKAGGWKIVESKDIPVKFRRSRGMLPLPMPEKGGDINELKSFININETDIVLLFAWMVNCFNPNKPFPVMAFHGEHGSAKSTNTEVVRSLTDPNKAPLRTLPKSERDLAIAANNSYVQSYDNLSGITNEISDALCRLSTGGGLATRQLFTDSEEIIFEAKCPVILNGIDELATRPDLMDRSLILNCPTIPEELRKTRSEFDTEFNQKKGLIFAGILDKLSDALRKLSSVVIKKKPRMADFAAFGTAAFGEIFLERYLVTRKESNEIALESSPIGLAVIQLMEERDCWEGTSQQLLSALNNLADDAVNQSKYFPKQPNHLSKALKRITPNLRLKGIEINRGKGGDRRKYILQKVRK